MSFSIFSQFFFLHFSNQSVYVDAICHFQCFLFFSSYIFQINFSNWNWKCPRCVYVDTICHFQGEKKLGLSSPPLSRTSTQDSKWGHCLNVIGHKSKLSFFKEIHSRWLKRNWKLNCKYWISLMKSKCLHLNISRLEILDFQIGDSWPDGRSQKAWRASSLKSVPKRPLHFQYSSMSKTHVPPWCYKWMGWMDLLNVKYSKDWWLCFIENHVIPKCHLMSQYFLHLLSYLLYLPIKIPNTGQG